jgi:signal transduction histidine kinase
VPRLLAHEIENAGVAFQLGAGSRPVPIRADRIQIEQVIVNLMQNAIDAVREVCGGPKAVHLRVRVLKGQAELSVTDTGPGLSDEAAERLFEPFFTTKARGLGMGLAISRSIIEAHHGRIWLARLAGEAHGTTVCFALPLQAPKAARGGRR